MSSFEEDYNNCNQFELISESSDPSNITTVSHLRHYINVHGLNERILEYFKVEKSDINKIINGCYGSLLVGDLCNDDEYLNSQIKMREESTNSKEMANIINHQRIDDLRDKRTTFCGIGTNKIKRRLNKLAKDNYLAKIYRLALEIEDKNIQAKKNRYYQNELYYQKYILIMELINLFIENELVYGKQKSDVKKTKYIIYFEIPNCEQISFHSDFKSDDNIPEYLKEWDGIKGSTLNKLEVGILKSFENINK